jgi:hypothetical protein
MPCSADATALHGDAYEIGIGAAPGVAPGVALSDFEIGGAAWAPAGRPIQARLKFWNKGAARSTITLLEWESPAPGVKFKTPTGRLNSLAPGESVTLPVTFTIDHPAISGARIVAVDGEIRLSIDVPVYPAAPAFADYQIADGLTVAPYPHPLGEGNGHAAPGRASPPCCPMAAPCAPPNCSPTMLAWTTRCASAKPARAFLGPPSAPPANLATGSSCWRASASTISPWRSPSGTAIRSRSLWNYGLGRKTAWICRSSSSARSGPASARNDRVAAATRILDMIRDCDHPAGTSKTRVAQQFYGSRGDVRFAA